MLKTFSEYVVRRPWLILFGWVALVGLSLVFPRFYGHAENADLRSPLDANESYPLGQALAKQCFPQHASQADAILIFAREGGLTPPDRNLLTELVNQYAKIGQEQARSQADVVWTVHSHVLEPFLKPRMAATDPATGQEQAWMVVIKYNLPYLSQASFEQVQQIEDAAKQVVANCPGLRFELTGMAGMGRDRSQAHEQAQQRTLWLTVGVLLVILLLVYRAPFAAAIPLLSIGASVVVATQLLKLLQSYGLPINETQFVYLLVLLFGTGTDFALFWLSRYREEQAQYALDHLRGRERLEPDSSSRPTVRYKRKFQPLTENEAAAKKAGIFTIPGMLASSGTTILGLSMMIISEFEPNRVTGPMMALSLVISLLAAVTLTPVMALLLGKTLFWPRESAEKQIQARGPVTGETEALPLSRIWTAAGKFVTGRPILVIILSLLVLLVPALLSMRVKYHFDVGGETLAQAGYVQGQKLGERYFGAARLFPWTCLVRIEDPQTIVKLTKKSSESKEDAEQEEVHDTQPVPRKPSRGSDRPQYADLPLYAASTLAGTPPLEELCKRISAILREEGAKDVWSYTAPLGEEGLSHSDEEVLTGSTAEANYWNPKQGCLRFEVMASDRPFAPEALGALSRSLSRIGYLMDNDASPGKHNTVLATGPVAYMANVKRITERDNRNVQILVVLAIGVILVILLRDVVVAATLVFSSLLVYFATMGLAGFLFDTILGQGELDWKIKLFSFVVLMAVGQDYNLFFLSRLLEERHNKPLLPAIAGSIAHSGSIISSCGLITAVAVGSLCLSGVSFLQQMGFVLVLGLLLDAFLVRSFLLPAVLVVLRRPRKG